jgi:hypothetical protein
MMVKIHQIFSTMYCIVPCFVYICTGCHISYGIMKHFILIIVTTLIIAFSSSCSNKHKTTIVIKENSKYLRIEYAGTILFNDDNTGILHISPEGYFKCKNQDNKLSAELNQNGQLVYQVNGGSPTFSLDEGSKTLLRTAVREIAKQQSKRRS